MARRPRPGRLTGDEVLLEGGMAAMETHQERVVSEAGAWRELIGDTAGRYARSQVTETKQVTVWNRR